MDTEYSRLAWIRRNRAKKAPWRRVDGVLRDVAGSLTSDRAMAASSVARCLAAWVDQEFRHHCKVEVIRGGMAVVYVNSPTLLSVIRRRWERRLGEVLRQTRRQHGISKAVFRFGDCGTAIP